MSNYIKIERPLYEYKQLREDLNYEKTKKPYQFCKNVTCKKIITSTIPAIGWIPKYEKTFVLGDLAAGFTIAVMHIPQGMAYALLANLPPVNGIYMAIFPVIMYFFLGTSKHASIGTFSIAAVMTGKAVLEYSDSETSPTQVAAILTLAVALIQLIMYFLRLGIVSTLLSEVLVNAFTAATACQIVVTQVKDLIGLTIPKISGNFLAIRTLIKIFENIEDFNVVALIISITSIAILVASNEYLKPIIAKRTTIPIPSELFVVVLGVLTSQYIDLPNKFHIKIVGHIPNGLPEPSLPPISLLPSVALDGLSLAIVCYVTSMSIELILAHKANYEINPNQELMAMGMSNVVGSLFSCMPISASLSRSTVQLVVGGKTQIVSIFSASILIVTLLSIGPFFEPLPRSVLASIIVVALKGMLMQIKQIITFWKLSKVDSTVWIGTFLTVVFVGSEIGLLVGISLSLCSVFVLSLKPDTSLLGIAPNTDLYLDISKFKKVKEIDGIKIFHYCGGINFATKNMFRDELYKTIDFNAQKELLLRAKLKKLQEQFEKNKDSKITEKINRNESKIKNFLKYLIVDFSSVTYLDPSGAEMLKGELKIFKKLDISFYIAGCSDRVYNTFERCDLISKDENYLRIFSSINDAVEYALFNLKTKKDKALNISKIDGRELAELV